MKVLFATVGESTPEFLNQIKLLLFSFRENAGTLANADWLVVFNQNPVNAEEAAFLLESFPPLRIETMPRLGSVPHVDKYNAFFAADKFDYDVLVFLDADTAIVGELEGLVSRVSNFNEPEFHAMKVGLWGAKHILGYAYLVKKFAGLSDKDFSYGKHEFISKWPLFNSGVQVITRPAVNQIRDSIVEIADYLYGKNKPTGWWRRLKEIYYARLVGHPLEDVERRDRIEKQYFQNDYFLGNSQSDQFCLALALLKHRVPFEILEEKFNWCRKSLKDGQEYPAILHHLKGQFRIDRTNWFQEDWIDEFLNAPEPMKRWLAELTQKYISRFSCDP